MFVLLFLPYALASLIGAFLLAGHFGALPAHSEVKPVSAAPVELAEVRHLVR